MSDFTLVEPKGWEYDLQSVYSAWMGYFQHHAIPWYDRTWGHLFSSFEEFLGFSWPVITVTDSWSGRAHIVTRLSSINAFLKMVKTRFGETLSVPPNILQISPYESSSRPLRNISDYPSYRKLHQTLAATHLTALKARVRSAEVGVGLKAIADLWAKHDKTFLALDFEWSERNEKTVLEWGYAAVRCSSLEAQGAWPPVPDKNYLKGHYIVSEYVDKIVNKHSPCNPWLYAFGDSQVVSKNTLPTIIQAIMSSFASPDSEAAPNNLVLVGHGISGDIARMEELKIRLPHNMLIIDTATYERSLYGCGLRPSMLDPQTGRLRQYGHTLSLENLLHSLAVPLPSTPNATAPGSSPSLGSPALGASTTAKSISSSPKRNSPSGSPSVTPNPGTINPPTMRSIIPPGCVMHNAGNDAFMCLVALQMLLEPGNLVPPSIKLGRIGRPGGPGISPGSFMPMPMNVGPIPVVSPQIAFMGYQQVVGPAPSSPMKVSASMPHIQFPRTSSYFVQTHSPAHGSPLVNELGQLNLGSGNGSPRDRSRSPRPRTLSTPLDSGNASKTTGVGPRYPGHSLKPDVVRSTRKSFTGMG